ncbi:hypothetical protein [Peterkaempfera griseoplana]|uniref:hypothetical protein n=1 Tax=Peterkaempfera griseoplana TaxID=66896 RepID=UPI0006E334A4|nr:hypothetical protein [Peterkaempfera griseoplana]
MPGIPAEALYRVRDEIDALYTPGTPAPVRLVRLRGLGPRLTALLAELTAHGAPAECLDPLHEAAELLQPLADGVEPGPGQADDLAEQAAELLAAFDAAARAERRAPYRQG